MNFSIGKKIALGFALALIALVAIGLTTSNDLRQLNTDSGWVDHTFQVQAKLEALIASLADAESGARGFSITADPSLRTIAEQAATRKRSTHPDVR
jgi:methyl-accepting chemotaxis protein